MKFADLIEREPKKVWKTGGQQVFTYKNKSVLYTVKNKIVTFKYDGTTTDIGFKNDPEKAIIEFLDEKINEKSQENRYVVTLEVELYMYDKDDKSVIKQAQKLTESLTKTLRKIDDNDATVEVNEIFEQSFGTIGNRKVK